MTILRVAGPEHVLGQAGAEVIPWVDQPPSNPVPNITGNLLRWEALDSRVIPANNFFYVNHYGIPAGLNDATWRLDIRGLIDRPQSLSMAAIKSRNRQEVEFTLECSGNTGVDGGFFIGGIGNAVWAGARLSSILLDAEIRDGATEVVFYGADSGRETIRDNTGITTAGQTGNVEQDTGGANDLTITEFFARSMSLSDALSRDNLLCYDMNDAALPAEHGFPVRLIAPGWYGVANVKWLNRIEVIDRRYAGKFMARDYVSIREELRDGKVVWTFTTVGPVRLKSAPAKVTRLQNRYTIMGAAWGGPVESVEVPVDEGPWQAATLDNPSESRRGRGYSWRLWTYNWESPSSGEHQIRSRAIDTAGNVQPARNDPFFASRRTFWESNAYITRRVAIR
jgi:DMSO/TMAO reductase YedYZ molybdopterin-dependent catalytic subunit